MGRPQCERVVSGLGVAGLRERAGVRPQGVGAAAGGIRPGEPRRRVGGLTYPQIQLARRDGGVCPFLERERVLVGAEGVLLAENHLVGAAEQHPGVRVAGEACRTFLGSRERAPAIVMRAPEMYERGVGRGEAGRGETAYPQPQARAARRVALARGGAPHRKARQCSTPRSPHSLIMGFAAVKLQLAMAQASQPLAGRRIVVTRAREQAGELVQALAGLGAAVIAAPAIQIEPLADLEPLHAAVADLGHYAWLVFTSQNTVRFVGERLRVWGIDPKDLTRTSVAAIGPATADALAEFGITATLVPERFIAEAVVEAMALRGELRGRHVLLPRALEARDALPEGLRAHGAVVDVVPVYRTVRAAGDGGALAAEVLAGRIDIVTFTSSSTVRSFVELVGPEAAGSGRFAVAVIGPVTAATARAAGLPVTVEATEFTVPGLVAALVRHFGREAS